MGGGLAGVFFVHRLGLLQLRQKGTVDQHQIEKDRWEQFQNGLKDDIENFKKIGEPDKVRELTQELADFRAAWRRGGWQEVAKTWN